MNTTTLGATRAQLHRAARALALAALLSSMLALPAVAAPKGGGGGDGGTDVNVVNTPTVEVGNVVYVVPLDDREPVHFRYQLDSSAVYNSVDEGRFTVPAGKRLTITFVSGAAFSPSGVVLESLGIEAISAQGVVRAEHRLSVPPAILNSSNLNVSSLSQPMQLVVRAGESVGFWFGRSSAFIGTTAATVVLNVSGYLEDM